MSMQNTRQLATALGVCAALAVSAGCATKGYVREQVSALDSRITPATEQARSQAREAYTLAQGADARSREVQMQAEMARDLALGNIKREEVRDTLNFRSTREDPEERPGADVCSRIAEHPNYFRWSRGTPMRLSTRTTSTWAQRERRGGAVLGPALGAAFVRLATIGLGESAVAANETSAGRRTAAPRSSGDQRPSYAGTIAPRSPLCIGRGPRCCSPRPLRLRRQAPSAFAPKEQS